MPRTALIVGAGIGGLSTGIALRRTGWHVKIFERAASPRELGFGLGLAPNAVAALRELGVADTIIARGHAPTIGVGELRRMDGTLLKRAEVPFREAFGGTMVITLRPAIHGALLDAVGSDVVYTSSEVTGFIETSGGLVAHLANGSSVEGDLLVGADGLGSTVRRLLHQTEAPPRSSGIVAVRGAVEGMVEHLRGNIGIYYLGPGVESMIIRASETGIYWFVSIAASLVPSEIRDPATVIAHVAPRFDSTFRTITSGTDDLRLDELVDRDPLPFWGKGVVTLVGDAAHPMLPHTGQGAAQAIVDAVALAKALQQTADIEAARRAYEAERLPKTAALVAQGRRTARVMRMTNPVGCYLRELAIRLVPVEPVMRILIRINRRAGTDVRQAQ